MLLTGWRSVGRMEWLRAAWRHRWAIACATGGAAVGVYAFVAGLGLASFPVAVISGAAAFGAVRVVDWLYAVGFFRGPSR